MDKSGDEIIIVSMKRSELEFIDKLLDCHLHHLELSRYGQQKFKESKKNISQQQKPIVNNKKYTTTTETYC